MSSTSLDSTAPTRADSSGTPMSTASVLTQSAATSDSAARGVHERFMAMFGVIGDPPNADHPEIIATTTGVERARLTENLRSRAALGHRLVGGYQSEVTAVTVDDDRATVEDCSLDQVVELDAAGVVVTPADSGRFVRTTQLAWTVAGWRVEEFYKGEPC
jgi:hypothetical protein